MGIIKDGRFIKDGDVSQLRNRQQSTYKSHEQNRQRQDHAREIIQPYNRDGKPNPDFIQAWPIESEQYGFTPSDKDLRKI